MDMDIFLGFLIVLSGVFAFAMMIVFIIAGNWQAFFGYFLHFNFVLSLIAISVAKNNKKQKNTD
jgi:membrane protein implicated in regulation of membrane protease activity